MAAVKLFFIIPLLLLALGLGLGALLTNSWMTYSVKIARTNKDYLANANTSYIYHGRSRGLFYYILPMNTVTTRVINANNKSPYFTIIYNLQQHCETPSDEFVRLTSLMKSTACLHIAYLGCIIVGGLLIALSAACRNSKYIMVWSELTIAIGEVAAVIGLGLFHSYTAAEQSTEVKELKGVIWKTWPEALQKATSAGYSFSYGTQIASLVITFMCLIIGIIFLCNWPETTIEDEKDTNDSKWLGSDQGTVLHGDSHDYRQGGVSQEQGAGAQNRSKRHSWSGYWEDSADKVQNGRFKTAQPPGYPHSAPGDRDQPYRRNDQAGSRPPTRRYDYYSDNPLYAMRY